MSISYDTFLVDENDRIQRSNGHRSIGHLVVAQMGSLKGPVAQLEVARIAIAPVATRSTGLAQLDLLNWH